VGVVGWERKEVRTTARGPQEEWIAARGRAVRLALAQELFDALIFYKKK
jgi:hypothetical protein